LSVDNHLSREGEKPGAEQNVNKAEQANLVIIQIKNTSRN